ncbi:hypothetical protein FA15DRAFT_664761, partial [Coprinopsis marcescibilis]
MPSLLVPTTQSRPAFTKSTSVDLRQFQLYAVEKWLVDRNRHTHFLLVYTADPAHTVPLDQLTTDDDDAWDALVQAFRRDGAKPKHTPHGTLMATSLAHFRSDWTIVHIPNGDFAAVRDQLFANINLLRTGCSGRSALSLDEPSDTTKDRFISLYHLPETSFSPADQLSLLSSPAKRLPTVRGKTKDSHTFISTVLELVKLIQAGLSIFGCYKSPVDGLLCDSTLDAINQWMTEIGEPLLGLEPTERVVDPMLISALLSLILAVRNKLATLVAIDLHNPASLPSPPKDPFLFPHAFCASLAAYLQATNSSIVSSTITPQVIDLIDTHYESATRSRLKPVRKVLRTRIDDLAARVDSEGDEKKDYRSGGEDSTAVSPAGPSSARTLTLTPSTSTSTPLTSAGLSSLSTSTTDLASFLTVALTKEKDGDRLTSGGTFTGLHVRAHAAGQSRKERRRRLGASISVLPDAPSGSSRRPTRESVDLGSFYHSGIGDNPSTDVIRDRNIDTVVAGSVKALWSGRVAELVRLREYANTDPSLHTPIITLRAPSAGSALSAASSWSRTRSKGKHSRKASSSTNVNANVHSDGEINNNNNNNNNNNPRSETEDDSEGVYNTAPNASQTTFGSLLGGKVKGKIGTWTALAKRRAGGSVDLSPRPAKTPVGVSPVLSQDSNHQEGDHDKSKLKAHSMGSVDRPSHPSFPSNMKPKLIRVATAPSSRKERSGSISKVLEGGSANCSSGPQSPTLPPMIFVPGEHPIGEDESEMLSSGQISPLSDYRPSPFHLLKGSNPNTFLSAPIGQSLSGSTSNLLPNRDLVVQETVHKLHSKLLSVTHQQQQQRREGEQRKLLGKGRPSAGFRRLTAPSAVPRISSWSDPMSAKGILGPHSDDEADDRAEDDIEEEEEPAYERLEGYAEIDSDEPGLARTSRPTTTKHKPHRPVLKRKHPTSSIFGAGSDGELVVHGREKARFHSLLSVVGGDGVFNEEPTNFGFADQLGFHELSGDEGEGQEWMRRQRSLNRRRCGLGVSSHGALIRFVQFPFHVWRSKKLKV